MPPEGFAAALRDLMVERNLSVRALARQVPIDAGQLSRVRNGRRPPSINLARRCDEIFGTGEVLVTAAAQQADADTVAMAPLPYGPGTSLSVESSACAAAGGDGAGVGQEVEVAARESARFAQFVEASNVGPHTLEQFAEDITRIVTVYPNCAVYPLFVGLRELRDRAFGLIEGRQYPNQTRELYLVTGTICGVLSNASFDLGHLPAARTQARTAFLCAEMAGHNALRAWIRGTQALIAYWDDRPAEAVDLARDGYSYPPENGTAAVRLASIEARACAQLGRRSQAEDALRRAQTERDHVTHPDAPGGMMAFPQAKQDYSASTTWLWLGASADLVQAAEHAERAVSGYETDPVENRRMGEWSLAHLDVAASRLAAKDLDGAGEGIHAVLLAAGQRRIASVSRRLDQLAATLDEPTYRGSRAAREIRHRIAVHTRRRPRPALTCGVSP